MDNKNRHLVSKYLDGELNALEMSGFEEALLQDHKLQEELDLYREVDEALNDTEMLDFRAQLDDLHEELSPKLEKKRSGRTKRALRYAVAASIAVVISLGTYNLLFKKVSDSKIVSQFYKPYDVTLVNRSANDGLTKTLTTALEKYENQEYKEAIPLFRQVLEYNPDMVASYLYSGISFFEIEEYRNAGQSFQEVIDHNDNLYVEQAEWYLGFVFLMRDEKDKAKEQFEKIADTQGYYQDEAEKILKRIK